METPSKKVAGGLAALALAGVAGVGKIAHDAEGVRVHPEPPPRVDPLPVPNPGPVHVVTPAERAQAQDAARDLLCEALTDLYDPESPGAISRDEVLQGVVSHASERAIGISVTAVQDAADGVLTAGNIYGDISPQAAYQYLRYCPPL